MRHSISGHAKTNNVYLSDKRTYERNRRLAKFRSLGFRGEVVWGFLEYFHRDPLPRVEGSFSILGFSLPENKYLPGNKRLFNKAGHLKVSNLKAGGVPTKRVLFRKIKLGEKGKSAEPITLCDWSGWLGKETHGGDRLDEQSERLIGGAKAPGTVKTYNRCFRKWAEFRGLQRKPALIWPHDDLQGAEKDIPRSCSLRLGPLQKSAATVELYLRALSYAHRLHTGLNPIDEMFRAKLPLQGSRRDEGHPNRKPPISCEDL